MHIYIYILLKQYTEKDHSYKQNLIDRFRTSYNNNPYIYVYVCVCMCVNDKRQVSITYLRG